MKNLLVILLASFAFAGTAHAFGDTDNSSRSGALAGAAASSNSSARSDSSARSSSGAAAFQGQSASQQGNTTSVTDSSRYEATDGRDWAPAVSAPNLTTGICMGSVSAGGSGAGFGISFGTTVADKQCQIRYNSIRLEQIGQNDASTVILCQVLSMKIALEQSGYTCPSVKHDDDVGVAQSANTFPATKYESKSFIGGQPW